MINENSNEIELNKSGDDDNNKKIKVIRPTSNDLECFIWNVNDAFKIRQKYRIIGSLVGGAQRVGHSGYGTLPMMLSPFEVMLGLDKGWLELYEESELVNATKQEIESFYQHRQQQVEIQAKEACEQKRKKDEQVRAILSNGDINNPDLIIDDHLKEIILKQKLKSNIKKQKLDKDKDNNNNKNEDIGEVVEKVEKVNQQQQQQNYNLKSFENQALITLYQNQEDAEKDCIERSLSLSKSKRIEADEWREIMKSKNERLILESQVFSDLWQRGYYISSGLKFGGTFLAYAGDPLLNHSEFIVVVKPYQATMRTNDILLMVRLSVSVKKTVLLSSCSPSSNQVSYHTIKWQGVT